MYLSDLRADQLPNHVSYGLLAAVRSADTEQWSVQEWRETVQYMTQRCSRAKSAEACQALLLRTLKEWLLKDGSDASMP